MSAKLQGNETRGQTGWSLYYTKEGGAVFNIASSWRLSSYFVGLKAENILTEIFIDICIFCLKKCDIGMYTRPQKALPEDYTNHLNTHWFVRDGQGDDLPISPKWVFFILLTDNKYANFEQKYQWTASEKFKNFGDCIKRKKFVSNLLPWNGFGCSGLFKHELIPMICQP